MSDHRLISRNIITAMQQKKGIHDLEYWKISISLNNGMYSTPLTQYKDMKDVHHQTKTTKSAEIK